jgi:hypothetical protein
MSNKTISVSFPSLKLKKRPIVYSAKLKQDRYKHDVGTIVFRNWDLSEKMIPPGTPMLITLNSIRGIDSYPGFVHHVKKVMDTEKRFVEVTFIGASYRMKQKTQKVWKKVTVSQVAKTIAKKYKLSFDITPHKRVFSQLAQHGESDWQFLVKCAKKCGYLFRVDGTTLIFKPIDEIFNKYKNYAPTYNLSNLTVSGAGIKGSDIYSFTPIVGESIPFPDATKSFQSFNGVNPITKKSNSFSKQNYKNGKRRKMKAPLFDSFDTDTVVPGMDIAKSHSDAFAEMIKFPYRANGAVVGTPTLIPGMPIYLTGVGDEYSGHWIILSLEHVVHYINLTETKYTTNIEIGIDSLGESLKNIQDVSNMSEYENSVYVEPNVRQTLRKPKSFIKTKRIPTQNDSNITLGKVKNFDKTISRAKNESYSYWESEITDVRLRQNKPSNRSIFVAQRLRRRLCCC